MRELWIKTGCFLTGYNYGILKNCSEVSKKAVKKYTAAMIIMCLLWGIIGYSFASRYLHAGPDISIACSLVFVIVIIQIERQIIMQTHKNNYLQLFRGIIAVMMAIIGSIIIDQVIFKDDIELEKEQFINKKVETIYPDRARIRQKQIDQLKAQLFEKDSQRTALNIDIQKNPVINTTATQSSPVPETYSETDPATGKTITRTRYVNKPTTARSQIPNPNIALIAPLDSQINSLQRMILSQGAVTTLLGCLGGAAGALMLTRVIRAFLFEVSPLDPVTYGAVGILLSVTTVLACYMPARRATRVDPMVALRYE